MRHVRWYAIVAHVLYHLPVVRLIRGQERIISVNRQGGESQQNKQCER